jgi:hypothetical protein
MASNDMEGLQFNIDMDKGPNSLSSAQPAPQQVAQNPNVEQMGQDMKYKNAMPGFLKQSGHPSICLLHFAFKVTAIVCYLLLNMFIDNLVMTFIVVILLGAMDFYVTKNITGR